MRSQLSRDHEFQFSQPPAPGEPLTGPHGKPPSIDVRGGINFGKRPDFDARAIPDEKRWQYADTITLTLRDHTIKSGVDVSHVRTLRDGLYHEGGQYSYATLNDFIVDYANYAAAGALRAAGRMCSTSARPAGQCYVGGYNQAFGRAASDFTTNDYGLFVQDDYRLSSRMTLNLGLRYEYQQLPKPQLANPLSNLPGALFGPEQTRSFPSDKNDVEPRLGFAYSVTGTGRTMIRGGYGIHHGRIRTPLSRLPSTAPGRPSLKVSINSFPREIPRPRFSRTRSRACRVQRTRHTSSCSTPTCSVPPFVTVIGCSSTLSDRIPSSRRRIFSLPDTIFRRLSTSICRRRRRGPTRSSVAISMPRR